MSTVLEGPSAPHQRIARFAKGDINAFFGLMLDNIGDMILMATLLVSLGFPAEFVLLKMIPGTAIGVLVGDLLYTFTAWWLARKTGRNVTAMPLGLDTPSTFGVVFLILGPAFAAAKGRGLDADAAAQEAWYVGIAMILASGLLKLIAAPFSGWIRRVVPRAGLLGSLAAIALVIISFLPLREIVAQPVPGLIALFVVLATLTARWELPIKLPGALLGVLVGCVVYYGMGLAGLGPMGSEGTGIEPKLGMALPLPHSEWWAWMAQSGAIALNYLPVAMPLALATIVGGIDCAESAAAAGDDYPTGTIIAFEGIATIAGGLFGGVIQSTPYIGHPAYKAMGARSGYTLLTALFVGGAGVFGYFGYIFQILPHAAVFPILIFVGLEITSQSFAATPRKHFPAIALACVPALAYLANILIGQFINEAGKPFAEFSPPSQALIQTMTMLSSGFIITSLIWATGLAKLIDGRARMAAATFAVAAVLALFGVIHSPLGSSPIVLPWRAVAMLKEDAGRYEASRHQTPYHWAAAYLGVAGLCLVLDRFGRTSPEDEPVAV